MKSANSKGAHPSGKPADKRRHDDRGKASKDPRSVESEEPRGIEKGIAEADKKARTGSRNERVRNTPPAGAWNDISSD
jgi:hypothetical protein